MAAPVPLLMEITYYYFPERMDVVDTLSASFQDTTEHHARVQRIEITTKLEDQGVTTTCAIYGWPLTAKGKVDRETHSQHLGVSPEVLAPYEADARRRAHPYLFDNAEKIDHEVGLR